MNFMHHVCGNKIIVIVIVIIVHYLVYQKCFSIGLSKMLLNAISQLCLNTNAYKFTHFDMHE